MIMAKTPPLKQAPKVKPSRPTYVPDPSPLSEAGKRLRLGEQQGKIYDIAMSKYLSNERLSAAETAALGLNHPAGGGVNLSKLPSEYTAEYDMFRQLKPRKIITPESMLGGASVPLVGDSADAGRRLISVNGIPLSEDINLQGGSRFGRDNPDIWSSGQGVVTVLDNQVERALEGVDKVYGPHVSMSGTGGDFNTMTTKTLLNLFDPADISEESAILFDDRIKKTPKKNKTTGEVTYPFADFVGIHHPELRQQLLSKEEGTGNLRKAFVETMNKAEFQKLGFPEPAAARFATSDRILLDKPIGSTGYEIMQFAPKDRVVKDPAVPHETYPVNLRGEYAGSLADTVPAEVYFKDYYEGRRLMGSPKSSDTRAFTMSSPIQYHDQAWLDNIMGFITARDAKIKAGEYAEGGMVESPTQEAIADTVQNPNAARMLEMDLANLSLMNQPQRMAEGGTPIGDQSVFDLKRPPEPVPPTLREVMAEIGRDPKKYSAEFPPREFDRNTLEAYRLMQAAKETGNPDRYLESLNPYFDSQIKFDIGAGDLAGYVDRDKPNLAVYQKLRDIENTVPHELEHTLQLQRGKKLDYQDDDIIRRAKAMPDDMRRKIFSSKNSFENPMEAYANAAAYAHLVNAAGGDFVNTPEGRALLPDRKSQSDYYLKTMPGVDSAFGYRENQGEPPVVGIKNDPRLSYAQQVMRKLGFAEGGLAKFPTPEEMMIELMERGYGRR
jgi:hypothetical protein